MILLDDGIATGTTMRAAVWSLRQRTPVAMLVAAPVSAAESCAALARDADRVVCLRTPQPFRGGSAWYERFEQLTDDEVRALLAQARGPSSVTTPGVAQGPRTRNCPPGRDKFARI